MATIAGSVTAQTKYTPDPTGYSQLPTGYRTLNGTKYYGGYPDETNYDFYIQAKAVDNGNGTVTFYVRKSKGTFQKDASFYIIKDPSVTGGIVFASPDVVSGSMGSISAGNQEGKVTITPGFTTGSHYYCVLLTTSYNFFTKSIKLTATTQKLAKPNKNSFNESGVLYNCFTANWGAVSGATGYRISVRRASESDYKILDDKAVSSTSYNVTNLAGNAYQYKVRATVGTDESAWSDWSDESDIVRTMNIMEISSGNAFDASTLLKGKEYTYSVTVKNNSSYDWFGSFYLKGAGEQFEWNSYKVSAYSSQTFTKKYTFGSTGSKTFQLYIQQGARGNGEEFGSPFTVNVVDPSDPGGDTPSGDDMTAAQAAQYLYDKGVIENKNVNSEILRQDLAKVAFRGLYYAANSGTIPNSVVSDNFPTVYEDLAKQNSDNSYYFQAAKALLYLEYGDGVTPFDRNRLKFDPTGNIQRINVLKVLLETFNIQPKMSGTNYFSGESNIQDLAARDPRKYGYIRSAGDLGIINTSISNWRPYDYCTRGEAFLMLVRIMEKLKDGTIANPNPNDNAYFQPLNTTLKTMALGAGLQMGNFQHYTKTSFALDGVAPLVFAHSYNSYNTTLPEVFYGYSTQREAYLPLADGWSHSYHTFITEVDGHLIVHWGGGSIDVYEVKNSSWVPMSYGVYDKLSTSDNSFVIKTKSQVSYTFGTKKSGVAYLSKIVDRNGNKVEIAYETGNDGMPRIKTVT